MRQAQQFNVHGWNGVRGNFAQREVSGFAYLVEQLTSSSLSRVACGARNDASSHSRSGIEDAALKVEDLAHPTMAEGFGSLFSNVLPWSVQ